MNKTLAIIAALGLLTARSEDGVGCLSDNVVTYVNAQNTLAGMSPGSVWNYWTGWSGPPALWVRWGPVQNHGNIGRDVQVHSWRVKLDGTILRTQMARQFNVVSIDRAFVSYQPCGSEYKEVGIECIVYEVGTSTVVTKVTNRLLLKTAK